jgi:O-antigen ligase
MILELKTLPTMILEKAVALQGPALEVASRAKGAFLRALPTLRLLAIAGFLGLVVTVVSLATGVQLAVTLGVLGIMAVAFYVLGAGVNGRHWALTTSLIVIAFTIDATLRRRGDAADSGMDAQTLAKLVIWGGAFLMGVMNWDRFRAAARDSKALAWFFAFALWSLFSTVWSITPAYTFGGGFGMVGLILFVAVTMEGVGLEKLCLPIVWACGLLTTSALALYVVAPGMAVAMLENGTTPRLAGITGSPNNLGRTAAIALFFIFFAVRNKQVKAFRFDIMVISLSALACLYLSWSRTSLVAVVVSIAIVLLRKRLLLILSGAVVGATGLLLLLLANVDWDHLLRMVSRKGSVSELMTLTGRTAIWDYVWRSFLEQPLLGYGYGSTKLLIPMGFRTVYDWTTTSSHNMFLQALVTTGVVGTFFILGALFLQFRNMVRRPHEISDALVIFVVISGLTEAGAIGVAPNLLTILWIVALAVPRTDSSTAAITDNGRCLA